MNGEVLLLDIFEVLRLWQEKNGYIRVSSFEQNTERQLEGIALAK
jgi:hypothetical protein